MDDAEEIEITPEMLEAGINEYALFDFCDRGEWVVSAIYSAMAKVAPVRIKAIRKDTPVEETHN